MRCLGQWEQESVGVRMFVPTEAFCVPFSPLLLVSEWMFLKHIFNLLVTFRTMTVLCLRVYVHVWVCVRVGVRTHVYLCVWEEAARALNDRSYHIYLQLSSPDNIIYFLSLPLFFCFLFFLLYTPPPFYYSVKFSAAFASLFSPLQSLVALPLINQNELALESPSESC